MKEARFRFAASGALLAILSLCLTTGATAQTVYRPKNNHTKMILVGSSMLIVTVPKGWVLDAADARSHDLSAAFVRTGATWANSGAVMYVNVLPKGKGQSARTIIENDLAGARQHSPQGTITPDKSLPAYNKKPLPVYVFSHVSEKTYKERVAYVETSTAVLLVVLSAYTEAAYKSSLADHTSLVRSLITPVPGKVPGKPAT